MPDEKGSYEDENLTDEEKEDGRIRQPSPKEDVGKEGAPKDTKFDTLNPDRPDEFGDGDRRS
jgi:hypothetical protein